MYDITPFRSNNAGAQTTFTGSTITTSTTRGTAVTITTSTNHGLEVGDIIELDSVTMPTGSSIAASTFEDKLCQVITVPTSTTFTITSPSAEANGGGSDLTSGSSCIVEPYQTVGPAAQSYGYGFGIGKLWWKCYRITKHRIRWSITSRHRRYRWIGYSSDCRCHSRICISRND